MIVHNIKDLSNSHVVKLLEDGLRNVTQDYLLDNYHPNNKHNSANLFYLLQNGRFLNGNYYVLEDENGQYAGSAGWNQFTDDTALCLTRTYTSPKYRSNFMMGEFVLPRIFTETTKYNKLWVTVNDYNKPLYNWLVRNQQTNKIGNWPELYKKFKPIGQKMVNYTTQHVLEYDKSKENLSLPQ